MSTSKYLHPKPSFDDMKSLRQRQITHAQSTSSGPSAPQRVQIEGHSYVPMRRNPPSQVSVSTNTAHSGKNKAPPAKDHNNPSAQSNIKGIAPISGAVHPAVSTSGVSGQPYSSRKHIEVPNSICTNPSAAETYTRHLAKLSSSRPQESTNEERQNIHVLESLGMSKIPAITSAILHEQRNKDLVEDCEEIPSKHQSIRIPPAKPKESWYNNARQLSILFIIKDVQGLAKYNARKSCLKYNSNTNYEGKGKGKETDWTPREAIFHSPLSTAIAQESLDILIQDLEMNNMIEAQLYGDVEYESNFPKDTWRTPRILEDVNDPKNRVIGMPLKHIRKYAVKNFSVNDCQQELPIIVYNCVEKLLRGVLTKNLLRAAGISNVVEKLIEEFNTGPGYRRESDLYQETFENVMAILRSYLKALPHSLTGDAIYEALYKWCVLPTLQSSQIAPINYNMTSTYDSHSRADPMDSHRINVARALLKMIPETHLNLLSYVCAFFVDMSLEGEHNLMAISSVASEFADPLVYKAKERNDIKEGEATTVLMWILERYNSILPGLFDAVEEDPGCPEDYGLGIKEVETLESAEESDLESVEFRADSPIAVVSDASISSASTSPTVSASSSSLSLSDMNSGSDDLYSPDSSLPPSSTSSMRSLPMSESAISPLALCNPEDEYFTDKTPGPNSNWNNPLLENFSENIPTDAPIIDDISNASLEDSIPDPINDLPSHPVPESADNLISSTHSVSTATTSAASELIFSDLNSGKQSSATSLSQTVPNPVISSKPAPLKRELYDLTGKMGGLKTKLMN